MRRTRRTRPTPGLASSHPGGAFCRTADRSGAAALWGRRRAGLAGLVCLALALPGCANSGSTSPARTDDRQRADPADPETHRMEKPGMASDTLTLALRPAETGSQLTATLTNTGDRPVLVNARLGVSRPKRGGELSLAVTDSTGQEVPFTARVNIGTPQPAEFKELGPGESVERSFDLATYYPLRDKTGSFQVVATYANAYSAPDGRPTWLGEVTAEPVSIALSAP